MLTHFNFHTHPFATLPFRFPREKALELFALFDTVCKQFEESYDFSPIDAIVDEFILNCNIPLANETLKLKHLGNDTLKYKKRTGKNYNVYSYQYLDGLYKYLQKTILKHDAIVEFIKEMDSCHRWIKECIDSLLQEIEKKAKTATLLKIWKHRSSEDNPFFLPIHCDRTLFTVIVHTENEGEECLRMYPSTTSVSDLDFQSASAVIPQKEDFPLIFPGMHAKTHFTCEPIPHCVISNCAKERYSLVFFIARFEGW
ncbi:MAG: 2OG-Fe(II) oxygenase family protein [Chlamydiia bacterium]|nr:2OG-Fe(II) oxygenase family protein [Chlamydiia bacterium]